MGNAVLIGGGCFVLGAFVGAFGATAGPAFVPDPARLAREQAEAETAATAWCKRLGLTPLGLTCAASGLCTIGLAPNTFLVAQCEGGQCHVTCE